MDSYLLGLIAGSFVSIGAYSVLIGDNPLSKFTEHLYMGILGGFIFATNWNYVRTNAVNPVLQGNFIYIIAILLSVMLFSRLKTEWLWLSRYPVALTVGAGLGLAIRTTVMSDFLGQITATILPLNSLDNILMVIGTVTSAAYFIFTAQTEGPYKYVNKTGRIFLLAAFGVTYGQTVSFRFELVIGRLVDMLRPEVANYTYLMLLLVALGLGYGYRTKKIKWYKGR